MKRKLFLEKINIEKLTINYNVLCHVPAKTSKQRKRKQIPKLIFKFWNVTSVFIHTWMKSFTFYPTAWKNKMCFNIPLLLLSILSYAGPAKKKRKENENVCNNIFETAIQIHFSNIGAKEFFFWVSEFYFSGNDACYAVRNWECMDIRLSLNACQSVLRHFVSLWVRSTLIMQEKQIGNFLFYIQKIFGVRKTFLWSNFCFIFEE